MKLATLKQGGRDGTLVVVSRDLKRCRAVPAIARTMLRTVYWPGVSSIGTSASVSRSVTS